MNGILLALACFGALATYVAAEHEAEAPAHLANLTASPPSPESSAEPGSMVTRTEIDPETGEVDETRIIAFRD